MIDRRIQNSPSREEIVDLKKWLSIFVVAMSLVFGSFLDSVKADDITGIKLEEEMRAVIGLEIMQGYSEGVYKPDELVQRGHFAAFITRALKLPPGSGSFADVPQSLSLANDIYSASSSGLISGYSNGLFGPKDTITREQMAIIIHKSLEFMSIEQGTAPLNFSDAEVITSSVSKKAISNIVSHGIIQGIPNGDDTVRFDPKKKATRAEAAAVIYRLLKVIDEKLVDAPYAVATVGKDGQFVYEPKRYWTYEDAEKAVTNPATQFITQGSKILKMNSGIVYAKPSPSSGNTTKIYKEDLSTLLTYVPANAELKYFESDQEKIKVQIADTVGYVKQEDAWLVPTALMQGRSYYQVKSGELYHYIFNPATGKYSSYKYGAAPSFLKEGIEYYSWNGDTFYTKGGQEVGTSYQYFNMLSFRSKTSYTAEELNSYIQAVKPESPLKTLGAKFKEAEQTYNVNALFLLSVAIHESNYATSDKVTKCKNMFGIGVYDSDPSQCKPFETLEDSIDYAASHLSKNYASPTGWFYNGAIPGDKSKGVNVRYASDPYWGQKVAGHMYRIDQFLGKKDFDKYTIAVSTTALNVRNEANTNQAAQYRYPEAQYPMVLLQPVEGQAVNNHTEWWKIFSDKPDVEFGYVHGDYVQILPIAGELTK